MSICAFPVIDPVATGENIKALRKAKGFTVKDLQNYFGFEEPQAIYRWQQGKTVPTVDNLYALSQVLEVSMNEIIVPVGNKIKFTVIDKQQAAPAAYNFFRTVFKPLLQRVCSGAIMCV